ncbi:hypothetical protein [Methylobacterium sp. E-065]|nr:hypothetical protein [Methylobacterium sp. E-065]
MARVPSQAPVAEVAEVGRRAALVARALAALPAAERPILHRS